MNFLIKLQIEILTLPVTCVVLSSTEISPYVPSYVVPASVYVELALESGMYCIWGQLAGKSSFHGPWSFYDMGRNFFKKKKQICEYTIRYKSGYLEKDITTKYTFLKSTHLKKITNVKKYRKMIFTLFSTLPLVFHMFFLHAILTASSHFVIVFSVERIEG